MGLLIKYITQYITKLYNPEVSIFEDNLMLLKWKWDWWKECCWNGFGIDEKNVAEMEANCPALQISNNINIFCNELSATNCHATNCPATLCGWFLL